MNPRKMLSILATATILAGGPALAEAGREMAGQGAGEHAAASQDGLHPLHMDHGALGPGELLGMIRFAPGSAELRPEDRRMLDQVGDLLPPGSQTLVVIGGVAGPGGESLSIRRAEAVQAYLADQGVTETRIEDGMQGDSTASLPANHRQVWISVASG